MLTITRAGVCCRHYHVETIDLHREIAGGRSDYSRWVENGHPHSRLPAVLLVSATTAAKHGDAKHLPGREDLVWNGCHRNLIGRGRRRTPPFPVNARYKLLALE